MSITATHRRFYHRFPGPFAYREDRSGVENTLDVFCRTTGAHILSTYYWEDEQRAQLQARVACLALSAPAMGYRFKGVESVLNAFRERYPAPYSARSLFCEYYGQCFEVFSKSDDENVFILPDYVGRNGLISRHLAKSLNVLFARFAETEHALESDAKQLTA